MAWNDESDRYRGVDPYGANRPGGEAREQRGAEPPMGIPGSWPAEPGYYGGYAAPWYGPFPLGFGAMFDPYMSLGAGPGGYATRREWERREPRAHYGYGGGYMGPGDPRFGHAGRGPRNYRRADERIRDDISDLLTDNAWVDASDIEVQVEQGEVTLSGTVESRRTKRIAEDIAESVSGVKDVHNRLRVWSGGVRDAEVERSAVRETGGRDVESGDAAPRAAESRTSGPREGASAGGARQRDASERRPRSGTRPR